ATLEQAPGDVDVATRRRERRARPQPRYEDLETLVEPPVPLQPGRDAFDLLGKEAVALDVCVLLDLPTEPVAEPDLRLDEGVRRHSRPSRLRASRRRNARRFPHLPPRPLPPLPGGGVLERLPHARRREGEAIDADANGVVDGVGDRRNRRVQRPLTGLLRAVRA